MAKCPWCGAEIEFDDAFTDFEDNGDFIVATALYDCECGEVLRVRAYFQWDGNLEISK